MPPRMYRVTTTDSEIEIAATGFDIFTDGRLELYLEDVNVTPAVPRRTILVLAPGVWQSVTEIMTKEG